jgi:hypothetical protein
MSNYTLLLKKFIETNCTNNKQVLEHFIQYCETIDLKNFKNYFFHKCFVKDILKKTNFTSDYILSLNSYSTVRHFNNYKDPRQLPRVLANKDTSTNINSFIFKFKNNKKINFFKEFSDTELYKITPPIFIIKKDNIYNISDGFHRTMSRFMKNNAQTNININVKCVYGEYV